MQGIKIRYLVGGLLLAASASQVQAEALQPDPAWQDGTLDNGFKWQVLATPHRPGDRVEIRLVVNTGSLFESTQQSGFSHFISRLALAQSTELPEVQTSSLWQQNTHPNRPLSPVIVSYNYTQFNLSLPGNRSDLLKASLSWLANSAGQLSITPESIEQAMSVPDQVATWPADTRDGWWRYRLKGSPLLGHDPAEELKQPVDAEQIRLFYEKWYTPDAMTLVMVGNVESRNVVEQINKAFGGLKGKRETPAPLPTLSPLPYEQVNILTDTVRQDRLTIMWDFPWQPIRESAALENYWLADLAREALYWHLQQNFSKNNVKDLQLGFDCRVLFQRAQCGIRMDSPVDKLDKNLEIIARELVEVRTSGLQREEFDALIAQKKIELQKLFATYARTSTDVLVEQRLLSLQSQVVDIAPEQYQKLRKKFLDTLTPEMLNENLSQQLSQQKALTLLQPSGEPEYNMKDLQATWDRIMTPEAPAAPASDEAPAETDVATPVQE